MSEPNPNGQPDGMKAPAEASQQMQNGIERDQELREDEERRRRAALRRGAGDAPPRRVPYYNFLLHGLNHAGDPAVVRIDPTDDPIVDPIVEPQPIEQVPPPLELEQFDEAIGPLPLEYNLNQDLPFQDFEELADDDLDILDGYHGDMLGNMRPPAELSPRPRMDDDLGLPPRNGSGSPPPFPGSEL